MFSEYGAVISQLFSMAKKFTRFNQNEWAAQARFEILKTRPKENPPTSLLRYSRSCRPARLIQQPCYWSTQSRSMH
ncbi:hypothetical protein Hanom_Chr06g00563431 [Helianthus anomalus]